jgi:hypothetical protein
MTAHRPASGKLGKDQRLQQVVDVVEDFPLTDSPYWSELFAVTRINRTGRKFAVLPAASPGRRVPPASAGGIPRRTRCSRRCAA